MEKGLSSCIAICIINPKMDYKIGDRYYLVNEQKKNEGQPFPNMMLETRAGNEESIKFSPGEIIEGRLKVENVDLARVRKATIGLLSIEYARWGPSRMVFDSIRRQVTHDQKKDMGIISFEIQLPQNAKRSLNASHSEFYWLLEAKVDIDDGRDIGINRVIHIA